MQIFALDTKGRRVAAHAAERQENYTCLECSSILRVRGGKRRQFHFYHLHPSLQCNQGGKSLLHLHIQLELQKILGHHVICLEHRFSSINRIADVVWTSKKIVFEIQCSPLSPEEALQRTIDYTSEGYQIVWILHDRLFNPFRLSALQKALKKIPHYYTNFTIDGRGGFYDHSRLLPYPLPLKISSPKKVEKTLTHYQWLPIRQLIEARQTWPLHFEGDLLDRLPQLNFSQQERPWFDVKNGIKVLLFLYRTLFHSLLKKMCSRHL